MKVTFKKVRWRNLLSTGNNWTEITLDDHTSTLIIGDNGSGKSTFLDALSFGCFGKPFRKIRKGQLVNSINKKNCEIEIELISRKRECLIKRGIKPDVFEIWVDGVLLNQNSESKDYQAYLEKHILGFNYKTFGQIILAGSKSYIPFMQLNAADRRNFIEDLLDIQIFSAMSAVVKSRFTENKNDLEKNKIELDGKENVLTMLEKTIFRLEENNDDKIKDLNSNIFTETNAATRYKLEIDVYQKLVASIQNQLVDESKLRTKYEKMIALRSKIMSTRETNNNHYNFYEKNCTCPTCKQNIQEEFKEEELTRLGVKIDELNKGLYDLDVQIEEHKKQLTDFQKIRDKLNETLSDLRMIENKFKIAQNNIDNMKREVKNLSQGDDILLIEQKENKSKIEIEVEELKNLKKKLLDENTLIITATDLLKDGGIKTKIIKQYIPVINKTINKYLSAMGFLVYFELNETFDETIKSRYRDDFSYESFSEGEKFRIDLALMLAWRAIAKVKNSAHTNLMILDEVFDGSLDDAGIDEMMKIIQGLTKDTNMFIISHKKDQMIDKFQRVYKAVKKKNFSFIEEV